MDDSSPDEDEDCLREAVATYQIQAFVQQKGNSAGENSSVCHERKQSNRPTAEDDTDLRTNELDTTPGFRSFVAKKLDQIIDQSVEVVPVQANNADVDDLAIIENHDFHMFSRRMTRRMREQCMLDEEKKCKATKRSTNKSDSSSESSDEDDRLAEAAVSGEFVLQNCGDFGLDKINDGPAIVLLANVVKSEDTKTDMPSMGQVTVAKKNKKNKKIKSDDN